MAPIRLFEAKISFAERAIRDIGNVVISNIAVKK
jgi:hypothetical protein